MTGTFYGDITHLVIEHRYYREKYRTRGWDELVAYFVPRNSRTFEFVRMPLPARVITVSGAQPVIEYEVSANGGGEFGGTIDGLTNVTVTCSPEFLAQAQVSHSYLP